MPVAVEYYSDHVVFRMVGPAAVSSLRRTVLVPYSRIREARVERPPWPSMVREWRVGAHVPGLLASGYFSTWDRRRRRFLHFDRGASHVLTLALEGHPSYDEVSLQLADPEAARKELDARAAAARR